MGEGINRIYTVLEISFVILGLCFAIIELLANTNLLRNGVTTQGLITNVVEDRNCGQDNEQTYSVRFVDQTGQVYTGTFSSCDYSFDAPLGSSVAITYLPDTPTTIAPSNSISDTTIRYLIGIILIGGVSLIILIDWIIKRMRKSSLQIQ
jgi:hypothetical protein